jgi:hypothetical protein
MIDDDENPFDQIPADDALDLPLPPPDDLSEPAGGGDIFTIGGDDPSAGLSPWSIPSPSGSPTRRRS